MGYVIIRSRRQVFIRTENSIFLGNEKLSIPMNI